MQLAMEAGDLRRPRRAPRGRARRRQPAVHRRDHGHAAARRGCAATDRRRSDARPVAADRPGGDRVADRLAVARRARPDPQGVVVRARRVRRLRAGAGRRAAQGGHGRARGRRVPGARTSEGDRKDAWRFRSEVLRDVAYESLAKRERQRLHLRLANRLSEPGSAETVPTHDRVPPGAGGARRARPESARPLDRRSGRRGTHAGRRSGAPPDRGEVGRRSLRARAGALRAPRSIGGRARPRSCRSSGSRSTGWGSTSGPSTCWNARSASVAITSDYVRSHASRFLADITLTIRGDADAAAAMFERALEAGAQARRLVGAGAHAPDGRLGAVLARRPGGGPHDVRGGARGGPIEHRPPRPMVGGARPGQPVVGHVGGGRRGWMRSRSRRKGSRSDAASGQEFATATAEEKVALALRHMLRLDDVARALRARDPDVPGARARGGSWRARSAIAA